GHLENSVRRAAFGKCVHRHSSFFSIVTAPPAQAIGIPLVSPGVNAAIIAASGFFPFNFCGQPQAGPFAISLCAKPGHVDSWLHFELSDRAIGSASLDDGTMR